MDSQKNASLVTQDFSDVGPQLQILSGIIYNFFYRSEIRKGKASKLLKKQDLIDYTKLILKLCVESLDLTTVPANTIKTMDDVKFVVRDASGMTEVNDFLKNDKQSDIVNKRKNKEIDIFRQLWDLKINSLTLAYLESLKKLKGKITDINSWLKVVANLNRNEQYYRTLLDLNTRDESTSWNQNKVHYTFIVGLTIDKFDNQFTIGDIENFLKSTENISEWEHMLEQKIVKSFPNTEEASVILKSAAMKNFVDNLQHLKNRTPIYFFNKVNMVHLDRLAVQSLNNALHNASIIASNDKSTTFSASNPYELLKDGRRKMTSFISGLGQKVSYGLVSDYPSLIYWCEEQELFRLACVDVVSEKKLYGKIIAMGGYKEFEEWVVKVEEQKTIAEMWMVLVKEKKPFGVPINLFLKNRSDPLQRNISLDYLINSIARILCRELPLEVFANWALDVEKKGVKLKLAKMQMHRLIGIFLLLPEVQVPESVKVIIHSKIPQRLLTPALRQYFVEKVDLFFQTKIKKK